MAFGTLSDAIGRGSFATHLALWREAVCRNAMETADLVDREAFSIYRYLRI